MNTIIDTVNCFFISKELWKTVNWISKYYICPKGKVLNQTLSYQHNINSKITSNNLKGLLSETQVNHNIKTDLKENYQKENISTTLTAITQLQAMNWNISEDNIINGIENILDNTAFMGRWQTLSEHPLIICDMGHNEDGIKQVTQQIAELHFNKLHFVFGVVKDKTIDAILFLPSQY